MTIVHRWAVLAVGLVLAGCASRPAGHANLAAEEEQALNELVDLVMNEMNVEEKAAFIRRVEDHIVSQIHSVASQCGTTINFTSEPKFEDRSLLINPAATPEQIACVQVQYPFARPQR